MIEFQKKKYSSRGFTDPRSPMDEGGQEVINPFLEKERFYVDGKKRR